MSVDRDYVRRRIAETRAAQGLPPDLPRHRRQAVAELYEAALRGVTYNEHRRAA